MARTRHQDRPAPDNTQAGAPVPTWDNTRHDRTEREADRELLGRPDGDREFWGVDAAHRRFGGLDVPATLAGMLAALGTLVVLSGLAAAAGSVAFQYGLDDESDLTIGGFITGLAVLLVSFLVGGWVAGRMARYDGGRNGLVSGVWFVILAAGLAALGAWAGERYDVFNTSDLELPRWFDGDPTVEAVLSGLAAVVVALLAGFLGGVLGSRYHRRADDVVAGTGDVDVRDRRHDGHDERIAGPATVDDPDRRTDVRTF